MDALTGDDREVALLATMHQCAAELSLTVPQILRTTQIEIATEVQGIDWKEKRMFHLSKVEEKVVDIVESVATSDGASKKGARRRLPFGAVGTERREVGNRGIPTGVCR